ncbi:hypothetical protein HDU97_005057 [Phlyctochytrium planicorne]|nr:hypothetical protein HDU97_005057 [Phlyctochytrium planicorne]
MSEASTSVSTKVETTKPAAETTTTKETPPPTPEPTTEPSPQPNPQPTTQPPQPNPDPQPQPQPQPQPSQQQTTSTTALVTSQSPNPSTFTAITNAAPTNVVPQGVDGPRPNVQTTSAIDFNAGRGASSDSSSSQSGLGPAAIGGISAVIVIVVIALAVGFFIFQRNLKKAKSGSDKRQSRGDIEMAPQIVADQASNHSSHTPPPADNRPHSPPRSPLHPEVDVISVSSHQELIGKNPQEEKSASSELSRSVTGRKNNGANFNDFQGHMEPIAE